MDERIDGQHYRRRIQELTLLFEISQILDRSLDLNEIISPVLEAVAEHMDMHRGTVTLLNRQTGEIRISAAYGLTGEEQAKGRYRLGEGITGRVFQTGQPIVVPDISVEPEFLDRTGARSGVTSTAFICVPIKIDQEIVGALSSDRLFSDDISSDEDVRLLTIISSMISRAVQLRRDGEEAKKALEEENSRLQAALRESFQPQNMIGNTRAMKQVYDLLRQVAPSEATVLIRGESGTGKELIANALHYNSPRAGKNYVKVNCAALPEGVIESELFGHEEGAFTGAVKTRKGRFEMADGGTIFLDEIGELSPLLQVKLLRVIQEREIERVGGSETIPVDVRIIAATNRPLEEEIADGRFREDLFYRLNVFPVHLPPLRERRGDVMLLADHFVEKYSKKNRKTVKRISSSAIDLLTSYHWPGNVRELENCMERAVVLSTDEVVHAYHLPPSLQSAESTDTGLASSLPEALDNLEEELIRDALKSSRGNRAEAARHLGISERIMGLRVDKFGIEPKKYRT
ncbi:MAG: nif-specific transcriptional activator NifA [Spirochaetaceae bacterium]|nr:nif-specific transcriptional activator NifA [Spirochaetaceae bacterium]